jgi:adenine/guanine phosphoribosyltransferase-like PRPP-binding protein
MQIADLRAKIRDIVDFPTEGILFKDITTLLKDGPAFRFVIDHLASTYVNERIDLVVGIESRGFIFGGALAHELSCGFVPVRKLGKLPGKTIEVEYELEYGRDALAIHEDAIKPGQRVPWTTCSPPARPWRHPAPHRAARRGGWVAFQSSWRSCSGPSSRTAATSLIN